MMGNMTKTKIILAAPAAILFAVPVAISLLALRFAGVQPLGGLYE